MGDWFFKFEIDDENNLPFILGDNVFSYNILFQEDNENIIKIVVDDVIANRLINGHELRVYGDIISPSGLVGLWHFQNDALDESGNNNHGTITGATFVAGKIGKALSFDGVGKKVDVLDANSLDLTTGLTISVWIKLLDEANKHPPSMPNRIVVDKPNAYTLFHNDQKGSFELAVVIGGVQKFSGRFFASTEEFTDFIHVVVTYDGANMKGYINNSLKIITAQTGNIDTSANGIVIGNNEHSIIDEPRIYNRALTASEITDLFNSTNPTIKQLTATILGINPTGINTRLIDIEGKDLFRDTVNITAINNKYADQNTQTTVIDIINKLPGGFDTSLVQDLGISQPYNAVEEYASHLIQRIKDSTFGEIFARPDKKVVYRAKQTEESGLTITDSMIDNLEEISRGKKTIAESFGVIKVVGGNSTQAYDLNKKVKAVAEIPNVPINLKNRIMVHVDDRFTTWKGAKELAISLRNTFGKEYFILPTAFRVKDLTAIPRPGAFITANSTELGLNALYKVKSIEINSGEGETNAQFLEIKLGDTLQVEINKLAILQAQFESEKRKALDADTLTNQKSFSIPIKYAPIVTLSILTRNVVTNPYVWGDGTDETEWGAASWA